MIWRSPVYTSTCRQKRKVLYSAETKRRRKTMAYMRLWEMASRSVNRRELLGAGVVLGALGAVDAGPGQAAETRTDPLVPVPIPQQVPVTEGIAQLADTRLWFWDTGGTGEPIVLLHPASGSGLIWGYQQPAFAKAGYRVISYSRRGYYGSAPVDRAKPGSGSEDLHQ